jgi:UDP-3-O-[3-hydroxymyristoyl] glucosamine N-acyltransferase
MTAREIAEFLGGELHGDGDVEIEGVADISAAEEHELSFLDKSIGDHNTGASCLVVPNGTDVSKFRSAISVKKPKLAFAKIAALLHPRKSRPGQVHPSAVVARSAELGDEVFIGAFVCVGENSKIGKGSQLRVGAKIGDNVTVGERCVLHPNVFVEDGCALGNDVILHAGVVIGADGFGYVRDETGAHEKFPQIGTVVIEDNVEIGANSCVDRGALGETRVGAGTKIDNLVQIAHNVQIGKNCIIVALSGISGSSILEDEVVLAGQVGIADHVTLTKGVVIAAKSAVFPNKVISEGVWCGIPARPIAEFKESAASLRTLGRLRKTVEDLKRRMNSPKHSSG